MCCHARVPVLQKLLDVKVVQLYVRIVRDTLPMYVLNCCFSLLSRL